MATRVRDIQYHARVYAADGNGGPGTLKYVLTPDMLNVVWQKGLNLAGMFAFTIARENPKLDGIAWMSDHIKVWREDEATTLIFAGKVVKPQYGATDVICLCWSYLAFLQLSRTGYNTEYPIKKIGTEIVSPEWAAAKNAASSPLGFVTTGTIENPVGTNGSTEITTNDDFGMTLFNRLFVFFQLAEMGMSNTTNSIVFEITDETPHTFNFWKNRSVASGLAHLMFPGNLSWHSYMPGQDLLRNDRATVISNATSGEDEVYVVEDAASISSYRRLQDAVTPKTLMGLSSSTVEADQLKEAMGRLLKEGIRLPKSVLLMPRQGLARPGVNINVGETVRVRLQNEGSGTLLDSTCRVVQLAGAWTPTSGEVIQIQARGLD